MRTGNGTSREYDLKRLEELRSLTRYERTVLLALQTQQRMKALVGESKRAPPPVVIVQAQ